MTTSKWVPIRDLILSVGKFLVPVLSAAAGLFGAGLPKAVLAILKGLPSLMAIAEEAAPPGSGPAKKQAVMDAAEKLFALVGAELTGGAAENFAKYKDMIAKIIDAVIETANALAPQIIANDDISGINAPIDTP
jgi:hypothetical protein